MALRTGATQSVGNELGATFGRDPVSFVLTVVRRNPEAFAAIATRTAERTGIAEANVRDARGRALHLPLVVSRDASPARIAASVVGAALAAPAVFVDEARRVALRIPRGLDMYAQPVFAMTPPGRLYAGPSGLDSARGIQENLGAIAEQIVGIAGTVAGPVIDAAAAAAGTKPTSAPAVGSSSGTVKPNPTSAASPDRTGLYLVAAAGAVVGAFMLLS